MLFVSLATWPHSPPSAPEELCFTLLWENSTVISRAGVSLPLSKVGIGEELEAPLTTRIHWKSRQSQGFALLRLLQI